MLQQILEAVNYLVVNGPELLASFLLVLGALLGLLMALGALFSRIPGQQPEKAIYAMADKLKALADFLAPFSKKPKSDDNQSK